MKASVVFSILSLMTDLLDSSGCYLHDTYLSWHNGELGDMDNVNPAVCEAGCKAFNGTTDCAAWTINTANGWCAFKSKEQIKPKHSAGFESGILDGDSEFCPADPVRHS